MGASETSVVAGMIVTPATEFSGDVVPLGYPVEDKEVLILDEAGSALPRGQTGEIAIRSRYLATGYWRRPDLTARFFAPDPHGSDLQTYRMGDMGRISKEGYIEHLGRRDNQVKIRGYRVDLSEVEAALYAQEAVKEAAVVVRDIQPGEKKLVAYIALKGNQNPAAPQGLRSALRQMLPDYMVPSSFVIIPKLPRTDNGKLDASKLPDPGRERPSFTAYTAPRNSLEAELSALWAEVLALDTVGVHDNFLELGGHSLMATQLVSRILNRYGVRLSPRLLLESVTVEAQAAAIAEILSPADDRMLEQLLDRVEKLSEEQARKLLREDEDTLKGSRPEVQEDVQKIQTEEGKGK
jgi:acyl carrier protein